MEAGGLPSGLPINRGWPARPLCPSPPTLSHRVPRLFPKQTPKNLLGETQFAWESQAKVSLGKGTARDTEKKQSWASSLSPRWIPERALSAARSMMGEMPNSGLPGAEGPPAEAAAKMIVFGVSFSTTKDAFREYWAQYGELAECELMFARDGRWG